MVLGWDGRVGGWGGGGVLIPLDIHLHDDLFLLIASTVPRRTDALRLIQPSKRRAQPTSACTTE